MTFGPDISAEISGKGEVDYGAVKVVEIMGISESDKTRQRFDDKLSGEWGVSRLVL